MTNQAGWKCEDCRRKGLEVRRRCGWSEKAGQSPPKVVWARHGAATERCPKSAITGESAALVEAYWAWRKLGGLRLSEMGAREAHAFLILEREAARIHGEE